jgi:phage terminase small subunit
VVAEYALEPHHLHLLKLACEALDRAEEARQALATHGTTYLDRFHAPRLRPEVGIERDSRLAFARLCRELDLDCEPPVPARTGPPPLRSNRG